MPAITLAQIAQMLNVAPPPDGQRTISGVSALNTAQGGELSFLASDRYRKQFLATQAAAVIVQRRVQLPAHNKTVLVVEDADLALAKVLELFAPPVPRPPAGIDALARVAGSADLGEGVAVGPFCQIGEGCKIGRGTIIHNGVSIGDDVSIGQDGQIFPGVVIRERITVGDRVIIHANTVLGTDGFGYRWDGAQHAKVPQIGTIVIEDDVEIGSCVCIDRAKFGVTRIGHGTKIDNLVQIAHNVQIGPHCIIVGQTGIAGSAELGTGVVLGGQTAVRDHLSIGDGAMAAARSAIAKDVPPRSVVSGMPALPHRQSLREQAALRHLPDLLEKFRKLHEET